MEGFYSLDFCVTAVLVRGSVRLVKPVLRVLPSVSVNEAPETVSWQLFITSRVQEVSLLKAGPKLKFSFAALRELTVVNNQYC